MKLERKRFPKVMYIQNDFRIIRVHFHLNVNLTRHAMFICFHTRKYIRTRTHTYKDCNEMY